MKARCIALFAALLVGAISVSCFTGPAAAQTYTWDGQAIDAPSDLSGIWNGGASNWYNGSDVQWSNGYDAAFGGGTSGNYTVTLGGNVNLAGITFNTPNYTIAPASSYGVTIGSDGITANASATISAPDYSGPAELVHRGQPNARRHGPREGHGRADHQRPRLDHALGGHSYSGATNVSNGTLQLPAGTSGLSICGWTVQHVQGGYIPTIGNNTVMLTNGGGGIGNNLWCNTPVLGLSNQPWTASFTYSDTNGNWGDGGAFILQNAGTLAKGAQYVPGKPSAGSTPRPS